MGVSDRDVIVESYRALIDKVDEGFCVIEVIDGDTEESTDYRFLETNASFERQTGLFNAVGCRMRELEPRHEQHWFDRYERIARTQKPERFEDRADALGRWYDVYAFPIGRAEQRRVAILFRDVMERKRSEAALKESEERNKFLLRLSDALRPLADAAEIQTTTARLTGEYLDVDRVMYAEVEGKHGAEAGTIRGQYVRAAPEGQPAVVPFPKHFTFVQFGQHTMAARYRGEPLIVADVEDDPAFSQAERDAWAAYGVRAAVVATLAKGGRLVAEFGVHSTEARRWTDAEIALIHDVAERTWSAAERARADEALRGSEHRSRLLLAELQHRVRNILAIIRSIARRTVQTSETVDDYAQHLIGRISALGRTQVLLTRCAGAEVDLRNLVLDELEAQAATADQYTIKGPDVPLPPKAAEVLGLAFHELATNSVKYGALSLDGHIDVRWNLLPGRKEPILSLIWSESGVVMNEPEQRRGFGTELITERVPFELQGKGSMDFTASGLVATIEFPLAAATSILQTDDALQGRI